MDDGQIGHAQRIAGCKTVNRMAEFSLICLIH